MKKKLLNLDKMSPAKLIEDIKAKNILNHENNTMNKLLISPLLALTLVSCASFNLDNQEIERSLDYSTLADDKPLYDKFTETQNRVVEQKFMQTERYESLNQDLIELDKLLYSSIVPRFKKEYAFRLNVDNRGHYILQRTTRDDYMANGEKNADWKQVLTEKEVSHHFGKSIKIQNISTAKSSDDYIFFFASIEGSDYDFMFEYHVEQGLDHLNPFVLDSESIKAVKTVSESVSFYLDSKNGEKTTGRKFARSLYKWVRGVSDEKLFTMPDGAEFPYIYKYEWDGEPHAALLYYLDNDWKMYLTHNQQIIDTTVTYKNKFEDGFVYFSLDKKYANLTFNEANASIFRFAISDFISGEQLKSLPYVVYEHPDTNLPLDDFKILDNYLVSIYSNGKETELYAHDLISGHLVKGQPIFSKGNYTKVSAFNRDFQKNRLFLSFSGFDDYSSLAYLSLDDDEYTLQYLSRYDHDIPDVELTYMEAESHDGIKIPYYVIHKNGELNSDVPTLVSFYGGFKHKNTPSVYRMYHTFLQNGGKVILPQLRGGYEKGEAWSKGGTLLNKKNTFEDLNSVIQDTYNRSIAYPKSTHLYGRSNGGLTGAATLALHNPTVASLVVVHPVADMLSYTKLGWGTNWTTQYGDPDDPKYRDYIASYSPVEDVYISKELPPILIIYSENDDRVPSDHSLKLFGKLVEGNDDVFIYNNATGGHMDFSRDIEAQTLALAQAFMLAVDHLNDKEVKD